jgi:hypothetical protein
MGSQKKALSARNDLLPLSSSRWINAVYGGILARESNRGSRTDGVPVDQSGVDNSRNGTALLSVENWSASNANKEETNMTKDCVCGMDVEEQKAAGTSQYRARLTPSARRAARKSLIGIPNNIRSDV